MDPLSLLAMLLLGAPGIVALALVLGNRRRVEHVAAATGIAVVAEVRKPEILFAELMNEVRALGTTSVHIHDLEVICTRVKKKVG